MKSVLSLHGQSEVTLVFLTAYWLKLEAPPLMERRTSLTSTVDKHSGEFTLNAASVDKRSGN